MYEKFNRLLETNNVTPYRIHKETGISTATLSDWKNGKSEPKKDKIQKICNFFAIPVSYFYEDEVFDSSLSSYEIFEKLCEKKGVTPYRVCKETGLTTATISNWKGGRYTPKADKLQKIADFFEVPLVYLMTGEQEPNGTTLTSRDERDIMKILDQTKEQLLSQEGLMFDGDPASPEAIDSILAAMQIGMEMAKKKNKEKYTPKKYKKD